MDRLNKQHGVRRLRIHLQENKRQPYIANGDVLHKRAAVANGESEVQLHIWRAQREERSCLGAMTRCYRALCQSQFISLSNDGAEDLAQPCLATVAGERQEQARLRQRWRSVADTSTSVYVKVAVSSQLRESRLLLDSGYTRFCASQTLHAVQEIYWITRGDPCNPFLFVIFGLPPQFDVMYQKE